MKKVSILLLEGCTPIAPIGAMELLRKAGIIHQQITGCHPPFFDVELVALKEKEQANECGYEIHAGKLLQDVTETDILLIPAMEFDVAEKLEANKEAIGAIQSLYKKGVAIGSMCTGAFLLGASGLLDGKEATTHWYMSNTFKQMFPKVKLADERVIVDNGRLYTCGGATSFINLVLYMVEKYCGKETAAMTSKMLLIDYQKPAQNSFAIFIPQMQHEDKEILKVQHRLQEDSKLYTVAELADIANMSLSTFQRRFKKATGEMPLKYIQKVLVEKTKGYLSTTNMTFEEISFKVGYNDSASFRNIFSKHTGTTPLQYRKKYSFTS